MVISADGYEDLKLNIKREGKSYAYTYTAEVSLTPPRTLRLVRLTQSPHPSAPTAVLAVTPSTEVAENTTVTVTATPHEGYEVESVTASQGNDIVVDLTAGAENGVYTFTMPASNVTVSATFKTVAPAEAGKIGLSQLEIAKASFGNDWILKFKNATGM